MDPSSLSCTRLNANHIVLGTPLCPLLDKSDTVASRECRCRFVTYIVSTALLVLLFCFGPSTTGVHHPDPSVRKSIQAAESVKNLPSVGVGVDNCHESASLTRESSTPACGRIAFCSTKQQSRKSAILHGHTLGFGPHGTPVSAAPTLLTLGVLLRP